LVEPLSTTANDHNVPALNKITTVSKLTTVHKTTFTQLAQFVAEAESVKVICHCCSPVTAVRIVFKEGDIFF
jgi:hypothetical protein